MRYWDTSAIVPMVSREPASPAASELYARDGAVITWWGSAVECASALARRVRDGADTGHALEAADLRLRLLREAWQEIDATEVVRQSAIRLLRVHPLRAADALQLAAAIVASEGNPDTLPFVTLDDRLADAAAKEGFPVIRPDVR